MVLRSHGFPTLPAEHRFEDAEVLGIRFPEFDEAQRKLEALRVTRGARATEHSAAASIPFNLL